MKGQIVGVTLKIMNGISFFPVLDMVSSTVFRSFSFPPVLVFLRHCLSGPIISFLPIHSRQECDWSYMHPRHQHLEPTQPLHIHPSQEWSRDEQTDMLQFFYGDS